MRKDIQDALLSVGEVAVFAWSLLELLLTRILPLAGFLAGHLLLQFCRLLASVVLAAAGQRKPKAKYSPDVKAEQLIAENKAQVVKEDGDHQNDSESWKSSDKLEVKQEILREESLISASLTHDEDADMQAAGMPAATITDDATTASTFTDATATITDAPAQLVAEQVHVSESVPSDAAANEVPAHASDYGHVANETERFDLGWNVIGEEQQHVPANPEGRTDMEASDVRRISTEGEMRRRIRVLPPSLSQVKRTLMQRSRRASASPSTGSTPSPMKKKHNISPRSRKIASPAMKSSTSSSNNFMGKFRKHFSIDPT